MAIRHLFTHTDLDGVGCAVITKIVDPGVIIHYCDYGNIDEEIMNFISSIDPKEKVDILITDLSPKNDETVKELDRLYHISGNSIQLLDHHKTAESLNQYDWAIVKTDTRHWYTHDNDKKPIMEETPFSGTSLTYSYLLPSINGLSDDVDAALYMFTYYVTLHDTWAWVNSPNGEIAKKLNTLFGMINREEFIEWIMDCILIKNDIDFSKYDVLISWREQDINNVIDAKEKAMIVSPIMGGDYTFGIVFSDRYASMIGNQLSIRHPELDGIIIISMPYGISFRTDRDDIDVSEIAKHYGGGGHRKASGASLNNQKVKEFINSLFNPTRMVVGVM